MGNLQSVNIKPVCGGKRRHISIFALSFIVKAGKRNPACQGCLQGMVGGRLPNGLLLCVSGSLYPHQGYLKNLPARRRQFV
ncbi:hypothetical protein [Eikenella halliae]|uniref:Uncharacterized protein n=1 Tax=Eikenella halliae TaxID=1795832 RepID=A0A1B6W1N0_9NEIS|nr:hypothetical protein [Eikenella halliae]OAM44849.1 hypothetical protein A7Q00_00760 [Eikenella halliae]